MSFNTIKYEVKGALAFLALNRPDKLNAINGEMVRELNAALDAAEADDAVRVIVLHGQGKAFSAGFDLDGGEGSDDPAALRKELTDDFDIIMRFWHSPKVTVAAVHKYCLGSAMEMAVACDITIAADECRFGAPEVKFGSGIVAMVLPWFAGPKRAKELLLTGNDRITSQQAEAFGLVNRVVLAENLIAEATKTAREIAANDALAVTKTKEAINRGYDAAGMTAALSQALELDIFVESTETEESRRFNQILRDEGAKAAISWRDARLDASTDN
ncbi:MAG: enoyl-CoA hydratase/isomerase family protein [Gammaproteobacteria bacterium]